MNTQDKQRINVMDKPVYHYHLHVVAVPTVDKEIKWSKRCKDESLRGTVKEVIHQVSHSKKWKNQPVLDESGKQIIGENGKGKTVKSYSILQDQLFEHMSSAGFKDLRLRRAVAEVTFDDKTVHTLPPVKPYLS